MQCFRIFICLSSAVYGFMLNVFITDSLNKLCRFLAISVRFSSVADHLSHFRDQIKITITFRRLVNKRSASLSRVHTFGVCHLETDCSVMCM